MMGAFSTMLEATSGFSGSLQLCCSVHLVDPEVNSFGHLRLGFVLGSFVICGLVNWNWNVRILVLSGENCDGG